MWSLNGMQATISLTAPNPTERGGQILADVVCGQELVKAGLILGAL